MIRTFKHLRLCFFFIILIFKSDSAPIPQPEEGFRWRQNLILNYDGQEIIDLDCASVIDEYQRMSEFENLISHILPKSNIDRNVALARISVIFQDSSTGTLYRISDWIKWHGVREEISDQLAVFISGTGPFLSEPRKHILEGRIGNGIHEISWQELEEENASVFRLKLKQLFESGAKRNLDEGERAERLEEVREHDSQFHMRYHHSEQWILTYLDRSHSDKRTTLIKAMDSLIHKYRTNGNFKTGAQILSVVLHIHSKNDVCERCTQTISRIMAQCNSLVSRLKAHIARAYDTAGSPTFLILTSSRVNYEKRRDLHGHDSNLGDPIDLKALPPLFIQSVAIDSPLPQSDLVRLP